jgi:hypothetical protein
MVVDEDVTGVILIRSNWVPGVGVGLVVDAVPQRLNPTTGGFGVTCIRFAP